MKALSIQQHRDSLIALGKAVLEIEAQAILALKPRLDDQFVAACDILLNTEGRVIVIGMGKSGHIGKKIAATLASTGTPAFFVHPGEACHGDMGMITPKDCVLCLSHSGKTDEVMSLIPFLKRLGAPMVAMTGHPESPLAKAADIHLDVSIEKEACPLGLAPTASTTATLAMGDALAVALLERRGFTAEDFALSHPAGTLGRRLLLKVDDIMHQGNKLPRAFPDMTISEALLEMTQKGLGMIAIVDAQAQVLGVFTDGDLRRTLTRNLDIHTTKLGTEMTTPCATIVCGTLAAEALAVMEKKRINGLLIVDNTGALVGALNMQDLLHAQVI
ncbi:MAG: SIS domain-containing protein [Gammaproteobacteria bacterium]